MLQGFHVLLEAPSPRSAPGAGVCKCGCGLLQVGIDLLVIPPAAPHGSLAGSILALTRNSDAPWPSSRCLDGLLAAIQMPLVFLNRSDNTSGAALSIISPSFTSACPRIQNEMATN